MTRGQSPPAHDDGADLVMRTLLGERALLLAYINVLVRDLHLAEDILQEALVLAMRQRFADADHGRAWMRVTARNLASNERRRVRRQRTRLSDAAVEALDPLWDDVGDDVAHSQRIVALRACCGRLSDHAKRLIDLRFHRGLDGEAIARALDRPLNTVYVALSRIYRRLADCMRRSAES